jgi:hypothetical protein
MSVCPSVRQSVRMEQLGSNSVDFHEIWCLKFFRKIVENIQVSINPLKAELNPIFHMLALLGAHHIFHVSGLRVKSDKNNRYCIWRPLDFFLLYLAQFFLRDVFQEKKVVELIKTHTLCSVKFYFRKSCRLWDNVEIFVEWGRPQMTVGRMRSACWVPKATNTLQLWLQERASLLRYMYIAYILINLGAQRVFEGVTKWQN